MSRPPSVTPEANRVGLWGAIGLFSLVGLAAGAAQAQSASSTLSSFRTGYGGAGVSGLESPVSPSLISSSSQYSVSDGVNQAGVSGSVVTTQNATGQNATGQGSSSQYSSGQSSGGAGQSYTGVGQGAVSNERMPVAVVETTNRNAHGGATAPTTQTNPTSPQPSATTNGSAPSDLVLNGKLNLDGGQ